MSIQYYVVAAIVALIVLLQVISFFRNLAVINKLKVLFPYTGNLSLNTEDNVIECASVNEEFKDTLVDINGYLRQNKNKAADYQIVKEMVERDSHRIEEDVDTMLSNPLYLGLMATISGAAVGVIFFAFTDLESLLTGTQIEAGGIKTLLTDIGIALIASFLGVMFTAISTSCYKNARGEMLKMKNQFLSWIQTQVMPNMSDDFTSVITKMTQDLNHFNGTFAENTRELKEALSLVTNSYEGQVDLLDAINKLKIDKIAKANIEVYDKLHGCTEEIQKLFDHLGKSEQYIAQVRDLNAKLGDIEERTRLSEELGNYFKGELEYVQERQGLMRQQMSGLDSVVQEALNNLGNSLAASISGLTDKFQQQNQQVQNLIEEQQQTLSKALEEQHSVINKKIAEIDNPFGGLKDTFKEIGEQSKKGVESISSAFETQNVAIKEMLGTQKELLETEIVAQRENLKEQLPLFPAQMSELIKVMEKLNQTVERQQRNLDEQASAIQDLAATIGTPVMPKKKTEEKWISYLIVLGACGSFLLLLLMFLLPLFN